jgi:hypothetical protein
MDEQFRMLGRERQADLIREAERFALGDQVRRGRSAPVRTRLRRIASLFRGLAHTRVTSEHHGRIATNRAAADDRA